MDHEHAEDVCSASAAYASDILPEIIALPAPERYRRLKELFLTSLCAYFDCRRPWLIPPVPSDN